MKNTVITGSSRGIGKAVAEEFAKNGYHVVINASKRAIAKLKINCSSNPT